jgi:SAM-dependent methyltransferase
MYDGLSEFYNLFMQDVDYNGWCDFICEHIIGSKNGMDVGCGSGTLTLMLKQRGYDVFGVDLSPEMIAIAQKNAKKTANNVNFAVADAEKIKLDKKLDFITATCDVVNYLKNPFDFFKNTYNNLNEDGIFIFDVSSEYKLKKILGDNVYTEERNGVVYVWSNVLRKNKVDMFLSFFRQDADGRYTRFDEEQTQYIHTQAFLEKMLYDVGFSSVSSFADFGKKLEKNSDRIHFIAKKANI